LQKFDKELLQEKIRDEIKNLIHKRPNKITKSFKSKVSKVQMFNRMTLKRVRRANSLVDKIASEKDELESSGDNLPDPEKALDTFGVNKQI